MAAITTTFYDDQTKTVIIYGNIDSEKDINFRVKNLVLIGTLKSKNDITINTKENFFNFGKVHGKITRVTTSLDHPSYYARFNDVARDAMSAIGISAKQNAKGGWEFSASPSDTVLLT